MGCGGQDVAYSKYGYKCKESLKGYVHRVEFDDS